MLFFIEALFKLIVRSQVIEAPSLPLGAVCEFLVEVLFAGRRGEIES